MGLLAGFKVADWLIKILVPFAKHLVSARADDERIGSFAISIVKTLMMDEEMRGEEKRKTAGRMIKLYAKSLGADLRNSAANTFVEVVYQKAKDEVEEVVGKSKK